MSNRNIEENVKRRLYAESMGRCMNPDCQKELFSEGGDIIEKAHIEPYCKTADNTFENLVILCPNCHTEFDKNHAFSSAEVLNWKKIRREELQRLFSKKYDSFEALGREVVPLLMENKTIYENYYLKEQKGLWDKFEAKLLVNNRKLKVLFTSNLNLFQKHSTEEYSNLAYIQKFVAHVDEFEATRTDEEKRREILFPEEINSMFGVFPMDGFLLPSTESLELLIKGLKAQDKFVSVVLGIRFPYMKIIEDGKNVSIFLDDTPRMRQLYHNYGCFKSAKVRLGSLNYALSYIRSRKVHFEYINDSNVREIIINNTKMVFVYEYCLSESFLRGLLPEENSVIVNLHDWNGESCISSRAYELAECMKVKLLTMGAFYGYINEIKGRDS